MKRLIACSIAVLWACGPLAHADATLVYELEGQPQGPVQKTLSVSRFFVRVDSSGEEGRHLLFQAGKFFPLFSIDETAGTYTRLTPPVNPRLGPESRTKASEPEGHGTDATTEKTSGEAATTMTLQETKETAAGDAPAPQVATDGAPAMARAEGDGSEADKATDQKTPQEPAPDAGGQSSAEPPAAAQAEAAPAMSPAGEDEDEEGDTAEAEEAEDAQKPEAAPALAKAPRFEASRETDEVAGISCRLVREMVDDKPVVEHCMANKAALGITEREIRTLARLFVLARERGWDWLGAASKDEEFVSIRSRRIGADGGLTLKSVSTNPLPAGHLRVPREYKEVKPPQP